MLIEHDQPARDLGQKLATGRPSSVDRRFSATKLHFACRLMVMDAAVKQDQAATFAWKRR